MIRISIPAVFMWMHSVFARRLIVDADDEAAYYRLRDDDIEDAKTVKLSTSFTQVQQQQQKIHQDFEALDSLSSVDDPFYKIDLTKLGDITGGKEGGNSNGTSSSINGDHASVGDVSGENSLDKKNTQNAPGSEVTSSISEARGTVSALRLYTHQSKGQYTLLQVGEDDSGLPISKKTFNDFDVVNFGFDYVSKKKFAESRCNDCRLPTLGEVRGLKKYLDGGCRESWIPYYGDRSGVGKTAFVQITAGNTDTTAAAANTNGSTTTVSVVGNNATSVDANNAVAPTGNTNNTAEQKIRPIQEGLQTIKQEGDWTLLKESESHGNSTFWRHRTLTIDTGIGVKPLDSWWNEELRPGSNFQETEDWISIRNPYYNDTTRSDQISSVFVDEEDDDDHVGNTTSLDADTILDRDDGDPRLFRFEKIAWFQPSFKAIFVGATRPDLRVLGKDVWVEGVGLVGGKRVWYNREDEVLFTGENMPGWYRTRSKLYQSHNNPCVKVVDKNGKEYWYNVVLHGRSLGTECVDSPVDQTNTTQEENYTDNILLDSDHWELRATAPANSSKIRFWRLKKHPWITTFPKDVEDAPRVGEKWIKIRNPRARKTDPVAWYNFVTDAYFPGQSRPDLGGTTLLTHGKNVQKGYRLKAAESKISEKNGEGFDPNSGPKVTWYWWKLDGVLAFKGVHTEAQLEEHLKNLPSYPCVVLLDAQSKITGEEIGDKQAAVTTVEDMEASGEFKTFWYNFRYKRKVEGGLEPGETCKSIGNPEYEEALLAEKMHGKGQEAAATVQSVQKPESGGLRKPPAEPVRNWLFGESFLEDISSHDDKNAGLVQICSSDSRFPYGLTMREHCSEKGSERLYACKEDSWFYWADSNQKMDDQVNEKLVVVEGKEKKIT